MGNGSKKDHSRPKVDEAQAQVVRSTGEVTRWFRGSGQVPHKRISIGKCDLGATHRYSPLGYRLGWPLPEVFEVQSMKELCIGTYGR